MSDINNDAAGAGLNVALAVMAAYVSFFCWLDSCSKYDERDDYSKIEFKQTVANRTKLHHAVINNDTELTKAFIEQGGNVNAKDANGNTALILAAKTGRKELTDALIEAGADVNAKNIYANNALIFAAARGFDDVAQTLIKANADVNAKNNTGYTALHEAAQNGHFEIAKSLIKNGADVTVIGNDGMTALNLAVKFNESKIAFMLMDAEKKQAVKTVAKNDVVKLDANRQHE